MNEIKAFGDDYSAKEIIAASGISVRLWRLYANFWLICLLFPVYYLATGDFTSSQNLLAVGGLSAFGLVYIWVMWGHPLSRHGVPRRRIRETAALCLALVGLAFLLTMRVHVSFTWIFVGIAAIIGVLLPARLAFWSITGLTLTVLAFGVLVSGGVYLTDWLHLVPLLLLVRGLGLDMVGLGRLGDALRELQAAREALARQAVRAERDRMARDLHDLLGHSLTLITLKSQLAARLVDQHAGRAKQEIEQIEESARQTLKEVRQTVREARAPDLDYELANAANLLGAAGYEFEIENTVRNLPDEIGSTLAWAVREGVTNVIRHSKAGRCTINIRQSELGDTRLELINYGHIINRKPRTIAGSGLEGLSERTKAQGGQIEYGLLDTATSKAFRLWITLPTRAQ